MMELELEPVELQNLLSNSLLIVREKAALQRIQLKLETDAELGTFELDLRKTKQIIYNLLANAVKFSAPGDVVTVAVRQVPRAQVGTIEGDWPAYGFQLADSDYEEFLELSVSDTGIGIAQSDMDKLFRAFSQIDSSLARKFEGTGLGLAMVKQLTELHGGSVAVASREGTGARFVAWLPIRRSPSVEAPWLKS
jgi:signal transduction histidine kinase